MIASTIGLLTGLCAFHLTIKFAPEPPALSFWVMKYFMVPKAFKTKGEEIYPFTSFPLCFHNNLRTES